MPSVGMRRTTRVLGARVLRSGRRLLTPKNINGEWIELLDNSRDGGGDATKRKERGRPGNDVVSQQEVTDMDLDEKTVESASENVAPEVAVANDHVSRRWGIVYTRKRKKVNSDVDSPSRGNVKRFGKQYFRRKLRKKVGAEFIQACDSSISLVAAGGSVDISKLQSLMVVVNASSCGLNLVSSILSSVLRYMWSARVGLRHLSAFISSKTIAFAFSSRGVHFLQGPNLVIQRGACLIWDANTLIPSFWVDYSATPSCFMYLNSRILLEFDHLFCSLGQHLVDMDGENDSQMELCIFSGRSEASELDLVALSRSDTSVKIESSSLNNTASNPGRNVQLRSGHHMRNRRSSLRSKRGRRPSSLGTRKANGASASSTLSFRHSGTEVSPVTHRRELRSSAIRSGASHRNIATNIKKVKSVSEGLKLEVDPTSCSANVLVMDSEKGYRVKGAMISVEVSGEKQWNLVIKKDGMNPYVLAAQNFMRPCSCNRFTHAVIWSSDNDWKLEFPDRKDWLIFKELYKKCSLHNAWDPQDSVESFIPVPGVHEVSGYVNSSSIFLRPASYISMKDDELSRALARRTANYDMDSEDEEWLNKFNSESGEENVDQKPLSAEDFELVIDAFEKGFHCNPDGFSDECTAPQMNLSFERRVLEAVYRLWIKKRKQRRTALVRVFQLYQRRRSQLLSSSVLRKKRSFKRQGSSVGRGKQRPLLQAMVAEQGAREQQNAQVVKVEEAKAIANRSEELAVLKRQRAQQLMETADLATYKAAMALKIAELSRNAQSPDTVDLSLSK